MVYGYARVSSRDQNLERQLARLSSFGIDDDRVFKDKKSGKDFSRNAYRALLRRLRRGDLLVITSIDRLGRNYDSIIREWAHLTGKLGVDILVLDMPLLDTRDKPDSLVGRFISDIVLQVLSFVAENERENIKSRQAEGIALARARGVRFGRPQRVYDADFADAVHHYREGSLTQKQAAATVGLSRQCFAYHCKRFEEKRGN